MGSLILGTLGSSLGGPIGGMLGSTLGSFIDSALFNQSKVRKPNLQDLMVQASTYGLAIPVVYGRAKLAGNMIMSDILHAEQHGGKGGGGGAKGGKGQTYYTYNATFAMGICRGPVKNYWRLFADSKLIWDMDPPLTAGGNPLPMSALTVAGGGSYWEATIFHFGTGKHANDQLPGSTVRMYPGNESQGPDWFFDQWVGDNLPGAPGLGYCPAYRGLAYLVFDGLPLADYGNRIPNISAEVNGFYQGPQLQFAPVQPGSGWSAGNDTSWFFLDSDANLFVYAFGQRIDVVNSLTLDLIREDNLSTDPFIASVDTGTLWPLGISDIGFSMSPLCKDSVGNYWFMTAFAFFSYLLKYDPFNGFTAAYKREPNPIATGPIPTGIGFGFTIVCLEEDLLVAVNNGLNQFSTDTQFEIYDISLDPIVKTACGEISVASQSSWDLRGVAPTAVYGPDAGDTFWQRANMGVWISATSRLYLWSTETRRAAWALDMTTYTLEPPSGDWDAILNIIPGSQEDLEGVELVYDKSNGNWVMVTYLQVLLVADPLDPNSLIAQRTIADITGDPTGTTYLSVGGYRSQKLNGTIAILTETGVFDMGTYILSTTDLSLVPNWITPNPWFWTPTGTPGPSWFWPQGQGGVLSIQFIPGPQNLLIAHPQGGPITLAEVVADICDQCGLQPSQVDVSDLTETLWGYVISQEMSGRAALEPLQQIYLFDLVETEDILTAKHRFGGASILTVNEDHLAARSKAESQGGENPQPRYVEARTQNLDLPNTVTLRYHTTAGDYYVKDFSYAIASQYAKRARDAVETITKVALSVAIVLTDAEAANLVQQILGIQYQRRKSYDFSLPANYIKIEAGDVITLSLDGGTYQVDVYLEEINLGADNTLQCKAKHQDWRVLDANVGVQGPPFQGLVPVPSSSVPLLYLLDLPPLRDQDDDLGIYWATAPAQGSVVAWAATTYESADNGQTYILVGTALAAATVGYTTTVLGTNGFQAAGLWDTVNSVTIRNLSGPTPPSVSPTSLLAGNNIFLIGNEIVGACDVTDNGNGTYTLSTLLRGIQGTDIYMSSHQVAEKVIRLAADGSIVDYITPGGDLYNDRLYKVIGSAQPASAIKTAHFTLQGVRKTPEAPVAQGIVRDSSGDATIGWMPRRRINWDWLDGGELGVDEIPEQYEIDIYDDARTAVVRTITVNAGDWITDFPQTTYSQADQTADGTTAPHRAIVYQISPTMGRGFGRTIEG